MTFKVAPLVGAWIEIAQKDRLCGLSIVAPLVGAWIEINGYFVFNESSGSRSPCGSVD